MEPHNPHTGAKLAIMRSMLRKQDAPILTDPMFTTKFAALPKGVDEVTSSDETSFIFNGVEVIAATAATCES